MAKRRDARTKAERSAGSGRFKRLRTAHKHGETPAAKASGPTAKATATAQLRQTATPAKNATPTMSMGMAMKPGADM